MILGQFQFVLEYNIIDSIEYIHTLLVNIMADKQLVLTFSAPYGIRAFDNRKTNLGVLFLI